MASVFRTPLLLLLLTCRFCPSNAQKPGEPAPGGIHQVSVGRFRIPFDDDRLNDKIATAETNRTVHLDNLICECLVHDALTDTHKNLLLMANNSLNSMLEESGLDRTDLWYDEYVDLSSTYLDAIWNTSAILDYYWVAAYMGIGRSVKCSHQINEILAETDEWENAGASAATILMALLPTFLAFGNLYVPRSSEAFATSWLIGIGAALYSLGLPVRSRNAVPTNRVVQLGSFSIIPLKIIAEIGSAAQYSLEKLQAWTREVPQDIYMRDFSGIRTAAIEDYVKRWHWWHVPDVLIAAIQALIFAFGIEPLFHLPGVPRFLFACADTNWTAYYLIASAAVNAIFRLAMWQLADHEVAEIYALSEKAKESLNEMIKNDPKSAEKTTETEFPPLYPPVVSRIVNIPRKLMSMVFNINPPRQEHPHRPLGEILSGTVTQLKGLLRHPLTMLKSGFTDTSEARRWRPFVVLIHLSTEGRPQLRTLFTGFIEAALLLILTFFFAAQWGGNLYITVWALGLLLLFITIGRALALIYVWLSAQVWSLHVPNCDEADENNGCLRIVCSMEDVLVVVNGAHYFHGHRLDYLDAFPKWSTEYNSGAYDEGTSTSTAALPGNGVASGADAAKLSNTVGGSMKTADSTVAVVQPEVQPQKTADELV